MNTVKTYHFEGKNATISGTSFQIAVPKEINRVSKLVRTALGLKFSKVTNNETKLYNMQTNYDGYNNVDFVLPNGASYNDAGSGSSTSTGTSSSTGASSTGTGTTYGTSTAGTGYSSYTGTGTGTTNSTVSSPTGGTTETVPAN